MPSTVADPYWFSDRVKKTLPHDLETEHSVLQPLTKSERATLADLLQRLYDDNIDKVAADRHDACDQM